MSIGWTERMDHKNNLLRRIVLPIIVVIIAFTAASCAPAETVIETVSITDMAGRQIEIPSNVESVFCADPMNAITLYTLAPDKLLGWCYPLSEAEAQYLLPEYRDLPVYGMKDNINIEAVIDAQPDIAILTGTLDASLSAAADILQSRLGIPVVVLDSALTSAPSVYALLGTVTGVKAQAQVLAEYAQSTFDAIIDIPENARVSIYYANGIDSLNTSSKGSPASEIFDMVAADNVCDLPSDAGDRIQVTKEHIIAWNPTIIFVNGEPTENLLGSTAAQLMMVDAAYANVDAVANGNVLSIPKAPFAWLDRPRSVNRLIGIRWLGSLVYPRQYNFSDDDIKEFYHLFYHLELTNAQVSDLKYQ